MIYSNELKMDFDVNNPQKNLSIPRIKWVLKFLRLHVKDVKAWRTTNGIHVRIWLTEKLHPLMTVIIQALCNSDYARECYNLIRVLNLTINPEKYDEIAHHCWNVLFYKKIVNDKVSSMESYDEKLTEELKKELIQ